MLNEQSLDIKKKRSLNRKIKLNKKILKLTCQVMMKKIWNEVHIEYQGPQIPGMILDIVLKNIILNLINLLLFKVKNTRKNTQYLN